MARNSINRLLDQLDELKSRFGLREDRSVEQILSRIVGQKANDAETLIQLHEILLFISAYPQSARVKHLAESFLKSFDKRVAALSEAGADLSPLDHPEVSGIIGRPVTDTFTYPIVRWLVERDPNRVVLDWEWFEDENRLAETWPRFMPLLEEDAFVEANVPYQTWLQAASAGSVKDLVWLVQRFESLANSDRKTGKEIAELFDGQKLYVSWTPPYRATRTGMRIPAPKIFYHREPLIRRSDVSLKDELEKPPTPLSRLSSKQGEAMLDMARAASTVRYRELYGFTNGDPARVFKTNIGRGVDLFIMGVPPERRLPLRAYHAALIFKNGVPVGYFEGISLFERMESGFNLYYTFREGETAWLYARILNIFRNLCGVTAFSLDPYQIGYENEEGIESGAFWFYRKLGFRPTNPDVMRLVLNEERKMAARPGYRTSAQTLRKLAKGSMIFELDRSAGKSKPGDWDRFQVRNIGLAATRLMAERSAGDAKRFRAAAVEGLMRELGLNTHDWQEPKLSVLSDFAVALSLVEDLTRWNEVEKKALVKIIRAKATSDESSYLKLMQKHAGLREVMIKLGSQ
ncbi:MAG: hypothetical protein ABI923_06665 [bacterium]